MGGSLKPHSLFAGLTFTALLLAAAACGGGTASPPDPTAAPAAEATSAPTATTAPTAAATPTATSAPTATAPATAPTETPALPLPLPVVIESVTMGPSKDGTLYEDAVGSVANGAGAHIFTGNTNRGLARRGVIAFDISSGVPQGAAIEGVTLMLNLSRAQAASQDVQLHRLLADWGEGGSDSTGNEGRGTGAAAGDATWVHTSFDAATWQTPGGDFAPDPSSSLPVGGTGQYTWVSTEELMADVQGWLDDPSSNFGWLLLVSEAGSRTAKRFDSRENSADANRPTLTVTFTNGD